jgi:predicted RNA-binding protein YlxR (DUF448 family)
VRLAVQRGLIVVDRARRLPGRGAYLCPDQKCAELAMKRRSLPRRLRVPAEAAEGLEARLRVEQEPPVCEN